MTHGGDLAEYRAIVQEDERRPEREHAFPRGLYLSGAFFLLLVEAEAMIVLLRDLGVGQNSRPSSDSCSPRSPSGSLTKRWARVGKERAVPCAPRSARSQPSRLGRVRREHFGEHCRTEARRDQMTASASDVLLSHSLRRRPRIAHGEPGQGDSGCERADRGAHGTALSLPTRAHRFVSDPDGERGEHESEEGPGVLADAEIAQEYNHRLRLDEEEEERPTEIEAARKRMLASGRRSSSWTIAGIRPGLRRASWLR